MSHDERPIVREPCDLLIHGAVIVTANPQQHVFHDGAVAITAGRIAAVGATADVEAHFDAVDQIDGRGKVVTPGLVNGHLHASQHLLRGFVPVSVTDNSAYLFQWVFPYYRTLSAKDESIAATLAGCDLLRRGITVMADGGTVRHPATVADGLAMTGIRAHVGSWCWDHPDVPEGLAMGTKEALSRAADAMDEIAGRHPRVSPLASTIGLGLSSDALLQGVKALADRHGSFMDFHQSFDDEEVDEHNAAARGVTPVEHLDRLGILDDNARLIHQLVTTDPEWEIIARSGASVVRCTGPRAAHDLATLREHGITVGVGSDTVNVSNTSDVLRVLQGFAAELREPGPRGSSYEITADDLFDMCTLGGARTLGVESFTGSLEPGKSADLVIFDACRPEWTPLLDPVNQLVLSADGGSVETVLIDGEFVVEHGRVVGVDEVALYEQAEEAAAGVLKRMGAQARMARRRLS